jgi:hypothetical protein
MLPCDIAGTGQAQCVSVLLDYQRSSQVEIWLFTTAASLQ